jgi:hypothetical protein
MQLGEVAGFLREMRDHDKETWAQASEWAPAAEALNVYWNRFLIGHAD